MPNKELTDNNRAQVLEYSLKLWGDFICGTKDQLQDIGIAVGMPFPGESGAKKLKFHTIDPRGFFTTIQKAEWLGEGIYSASIYFPGRENDKEELIDFAPGVRKSENYIQGDKYIGTADALIAAGLVLNDQFPGMPGMRKMIVKILPDGTLPKGSPTSNCSEAKKPGAKWIEKETKNTYSVFVFINESESRLREEIITRKKEEYELRIRALPRPVPLIDIKLVKTNNVLPNDVHTNPESISIFLRHARGFP